MPIKSFIDIYSSFNIRSIIGKLMNIVDSLPSTISLPSEYNPTPIRHKSFKDNECRHCMMSISCDELKTNIKNDKTSIDHKHLISKRYSIVSYGPIDVKVCLYDVPTLKTGRRSKFLPLEGDAAIKRELRREKNRELARKLKEKRINIERQLINEINELESHEKNLTKEVRNLKSYKQFLERRYQQKILLTKKITRTKPFKVEYHQ